MTIRSYRGGSVVYPRAFDQQTNTTGGPADLRSITFPGLLAHPTGLGTQQDLLLLSSGLDPFARERALSHFGAHGSMSASRSFWTEVRHE